MLTFKLSLWFILLHFIFFMGELSLAIQSSNPQSHTLSIGSLPHAPFSYIIAINLASQFILNPDDGTDSSPKTLVFK
jgi:hypothetical protein